MALQSSRRSRGDAVKKLLVNIYKVWFQPYPFIIGSDQKYVHGQNERSIWIKWIYPSAKYPFYPYLTAACTGCRNAPGSCIFGHRKGWATESSVFNSGGLEPGLHFTGSLPGKHFPSGEIKKKRVRDHKKALRHAFWCCFITRQVLSGGWPAGIIKYIIFRAENGSYSPPGQRPRR